MGWAKSKPAFVSHGCEENSPSPSGGARDNHAPVPRRLRCLHVGYKLAVGSRYTQVELVEDSGVVEHAEEVDVGLDRVRLAADRVDNARWVSLEQPALLEEGGAVGDSAPESVSRRATTVQKHDVWARVGRSGRDEFPVHLVKWDVTVVHGAPRACLLEELDPHFEEVRLCYLPVRPSWVEVTPHGYRPARRRGLQRGGGSGRSGSCHGKAAA